MEMNYEITNYETLKTIIVSGIEEMKSSAVKSNGYMTPENINYQIDTWIKGGSMWSLTMGNVMIVKQK